MALSKLCNKLDPEIGRRLQFRYTELQGGRKALPLTPENVAGVFRVVPLTKKDDVFNTMLGMRLRIPEEYHHEPHTAARWYVNEGEAYWRRIAYYLDGVNETGVSDYIIPYVEPPADSSLTVQKVKPIFAHLNDWAEPSGEENVYILIRSARAKIICQQNASRDQQCSLASYYYVNINPGASWHNLGHMLYMTKQSKAAVDAFRLQLPKPKDPTLTRDNIIDVMGEVEVWDSKQSKRYFDMPEDTHDTVVEQNEDFKLAIIDELITNHPYPRWEQWVDLLEDMERRGQARAGLAQEVKDKYVTMSDEEALAIVQKALKSGSLKQRNTVTTVTGIMGSGKTCLLCRLFRIKLPDEYTSTGVTGNSFRGLMHRIAKVGSFELLTNEQILQFLAPLLVAGMPEANVVALAKRFSEMQASELSQVPSEKMLTSSNPSQPTITSAPSVPLTHTSASTDADIQAKETHSTKTMVGFVQKSKKSTETLLLELIHMIDTGGQPEFMEVMPSVVHNSNLTLLVLNLLHSLDECPKLSLHEEGKAFVKPITSKHTNRQILRQLISTMQAKRGKKVSVQRSKLLVVATHKDCIDKEKLVKVMNDLNKELRSILLPMMENELIIYGKEGEITCAINLKNPDQDDETVLESIRQIISEAGLGVEIETPLSLFMFEQDIIKFTEEQGRHVMVVSFRECLMVGERLKMSSEVVQAALIYFHLHNIFLYFRSILPNLVFLNPQVPLDFVNAIVQFSYQAKSGAIQPRTALEQRFCREAIITEELLEHKSFYTSFVPGLYEPHHAIDLFQHIYTIAPLGVDKSDCNGDPTKSTVPSKKTIFAVIKGIFTTKSTSKSNRSSKATPQYMQRSKNTEYLMMCLLPAIPDNEILNFLPSDQISPIVIQFSNNCAPNGAFGNTVSCLISDFKWSVLHKYEEQTPQCLSHSVVTLSPMGVSVKVTLVNSTRHFEIHIDSGCMEDVSLRKCCPQLLCTVLKAIEKVFNTMQVDEIEVKAAFLCPCSSPGSSHAATTFPESSVTTDTQLVCSKQGVIIGKLQWSQGIWFQSWHGDKPQSTIRAVTSHAEGTRSVIECAATCSVTKQKERLPSAEDKPTLSEVISFRTRTSTINIVNRIGTHYHELGPLLLHDDDGMMTQAITDECHHNAAKINYEILKRWIQGEGKKPLQWSTLIDVLKKIELSELANIMEENLQ